MAYFPNMAAWEFWASKNCFKCTHWPKDDEAPGCPVEMAHTLYSYEMCNDHDNPAKIILDMLIPQDGIEAKRCAMFKHQAGVTEQHLRDWEKYKAAMAEMDSPLSTTGDVRRGQ